MTSRETLPAADAGPNAAAWEAAYLAFETVDEEVAKFERRLLELGALGWPRDAAVVELFCGRGSGLRALARLGFTHVEGVDLSPTLVAEYQGPGRVQVADCRALPFPDASRDLAVVQGGLHHLPELPGDLERTLAETRRVLRPGGRFVVVEPWLTPFLHFVHAVARRKLARRLSRKVDALQVMIEHEEPVYGQWLSRPEEILGLLGQHFETQQCATSWGKLRWVGRPRA